MREFCALSKGYSPEGTPDFPCPFRTVSFLTPAPGTLCRANVQRRFATAAWRLEEFAQHKHRGTSPDLTVY
jgi:hypothetical protein